eukprot:c10803_g1_i1.p1 GENE.c10803_g1_i1~~c10803_g1_i1.p1  ORF type:complete len:671 (-),score=151.96 c10803_g1_i1:257-2269(-)
MQERVPFLLLALVCLSFATPTSKFTSQDHKKADLVLERLMSKVTKWRKGELGENTPDRAANVVYHLAVSRDVAAPVSESPVIEEYNRLKRKVLSGIPSDATLAAEDALVNNPDNPEHKIQDEPGHRDQGGLTAEEKLLESKDPTWHDDNLEDFHSLGMSDDSRDVKLQLDSMAQLEDGVTVAVVEMELVADEGSTNLQALITLSTRGKGYCLAKQFNVSSNASKTLAPPENVPSAVEIRNSGIASKDLASNDNHYRVLIIIPNIRLSQYLYEVHCVAESSRGRLGLAVMSRRTKIVKEPELTPDQIRKRQMGADDPNTEEGGEAEERRTFEKQQEEYERKKREREMYSSGAPDNATSLLPPDAKEVAEKNLPPEHHLEPPTPPASLPTPENSSGTISEPEPEPEMTSSEKALEDARQRAQLRLRQRPFLKKMFWSAPNDFPAGFAEGYSQAYDLGYRDFLQWRKEHPEPAPPTEKGVGAQMGDNTQHVIRELTPKESPIANVPLIQNRTKDIPKVELPWENNPPPPPTTPPANPSRQIPISNTPNAPPPSAAYHHATSHTLEPSINTHNYRHTHAQPRSVLVNNARPIQTTHHHTTGTNNPESSVPEHSDDNGDGMSKVSSEILEGPSRGLRQSRDWYKKLIYTDDFVDIPDYHPAKKGFEINPSTQDPW